MQWKVTPPLTPTQLNVSQVGIFTNSNIKAYQTGNTVTVFGYVDVGAVQSSDGYTLGTYYTFAKIPSPPPIGIGSGACCSNSVSIASVILDTSGNLKFKPLVNRYPDLIYFSLSYVVN